MNILHHTNIFEEAQEGTPTEKLPSLEKYKEDSPREKEVKQAEKERQKRNIEAIKQFNLRKQDGSGLYKMQELRQQHRIVNLNMSAAPATPEPKKVKRGLTLSDFITKAKREQSKILQEPALLDSIDHPGYENRELNQIKSNKDKQKLDQVLSKYGSNYMNSVVGQIVSGKLKQQEQ